MPRKTYKSELSPREKEVLHALATYWTYEAVRAALGLNIRTVERHIYRIMRKIDIHKKELLIKYAIERGYGKQEMPA